MFSPIQQPGRLYLICFYLIVQVVGQKAFSQSVSTSKIAWADSCVSSSFVGVLNINSRHSFSGFRQVHDYIDGDIIAIGSIRPNLPPNRWYKVYGLMMRISRTGAVKWTKFIGLRDTPSDSDTRLYSSVIARNKDIVVVSSISVMRFDGSGNLLWQNIAPYFGTNGIYEQIIETDDSGFLLAGPESSNGIVVKLHPSGIMDWARIFSLDSYLNCRSIVETPSGYYFEGHSYNTFDNYSQNVLVKMNKHGGDTIWTRSFGRAAGTAGGSEFAYDWMEYNHGQLILTGNTSTNYRGPNKSSQSVVVFGEDANLIENKKIVNQDIAPQTSSLFRSKLFDLASKTGVQYKETFDNDVYLYRLNDQYSALWAWKFPMLDREEIEDMEIQQDSSAVLAGKTSTAYPNFNERAFLIKTSPDGTLNNCTKEPFNVNVFTPTLNVAPLRINNTPLVFNNNRNLILEIYDGSGFDWQLLCSSEMTCRISKIRGNDTVCMGNTEIYSVKREGICGNPIAYSCSSSIASIKMISDSAVNIQFSAPGKVVLYASMQTKCGILKDSVVIDIFSSPAKFDLGPDTAICRANNILLNAKAGYSFYRWQDGSTDSIMHVSSAGKYYVSVTDACGSIFTDTVNVIGEADVAFYAGPDRIKCNGDTIHLRAPSGFLTYSWTSNNMSHQFSMQNVVVNPLTNTTYYINAEKKPGCFLYDTLFVNVKHSPTIYLGSDTAFCKGSNIVLNAGSNFDTYKWNTAATTGSLTVTSPGIYWVSADYSNGCTSSDTLVVNSLYSVPDVNLGTDTTICDNGYRVLSVPYGYKSYLWQDGSQGSSYRVNAPGTYWVRIADSNGCTGQDTITINKILPLPSGFLPQDTVICSYGTLDLKATSIYQSYHWSNKSISAQIKIDRPGNYWLEVVDKYNCTGRDSIKVDLNRCIEGFFAPTAFTPNNDGKNDIFKPILLGNIKTYHFVVANRWGQIIFQTQDPKAGWDGSVNGKEQQTGNFIWYCRYKLDGDNERIEKGAVIIVK